MKINIINENSNKYRRLKRALFGDDTGKIKTFCVISVENPLGWKNSSEEEFKKKYLQWTNNRKQYNQKSIENIKSTVLLHKIKETGDAALKYSGANYVPLKGRYGNSENSFIIFNITLADSKVIARDYGQESFFFGKVNPNENATIGYYETKNACITYELVEVNNKIADMTDAEDFFSKFGFKYQFLFKSFGAAVEPVMDNDEFEDSLNENGTFISRASHRRRSRRSNND